jgi:hypothetical protein
LAADATDDRDCWPSSRRELDGVTGQQFGVEFFNADDRAAELNAGFYRAIPPEIRAKVNAAFVASVSVM